MDSNDPTIQSLAGINERDYVLVRNAPIFVPHERTFADGESVSVTLNDLPTIAAGMNRRHSESGVLVRVTDGHIDPDLRESHQPTLLGFASNAKVGTFGPQSKPAVLANLWIKKQYRDILSQRPYRSSEYYPKRKEIRGVALLLRDPQLDMGIIHYARSTDFHYRASFRLNDEANMSKLRTYADGMPPATDPEPMPPSPAPDADALSPDDEKNADRYFRYMMKKYGKPEGWMEQYEASVAGGTNTTVPTNEPPETPLQNSRAETARLYALETELTMIRAERDREQVERLLDQLEQVERYELDRPHELRRMLTLKPEERQVRAAEIRRFHPQIPGAAPIQVYRGPVEGIGDPGPLTSKQMEAAVAYQSAEKCSWTTAMEHVRKSAR